MLYIDDDVTFVKDSYGKNSKILGNIFSIDLPKDHPLSELHDRIADLLLEQVKKLSAEDMREAIKRSASVYMDSESSIDNYSALFSDIQCRAYLNVIRSIKPLLPHKIAEELKKASRQMILRQIFTSSHTKQEYDGRVYLLHTPKLIITYEFKPSYVATERSLSTQNMLSQDYSYFINKAHMEGSVCPEVDAPYLLDAMDDVISVFRQYLDTNGAGIFSDLQNWILKKNKDGKPVKIENMSMQIAGQPIYLMRDAHASITFKNNYYGRRNLAEYLESLSNNFNIIVKDISLGNKNLIESKSDMRKCGLFSDSSTDQKHNVFWSLPVTQNDCSRAGIKYTYPEFCDRVKRLNQRCKNARMLD